MQNKTFRLFISSTFSDFTNEREVLHKKVFPKIEKYCTKNGFSFQPIDLRWGVSNEAQLDQKTLEVCLEEVRACKHFPHPNFLIMAGDRYGYVPCPYMIESDEFKKIKDVTVSDEELKVLKYWYKLDNNQIYITEENKESTAYVLQPRIGEYVDYSNWEKQENLLRDILQKAAIKIFNNSECKEYQKYFTSATEAEVLEGICNYKYKTVSQKNCDEQVDLEYIFGYIRSIQNPSVNYKDKKKSLNKKANNFKNNLTSTLKKQNIFTSKFDSTYHYEESELKKFEKFLITQLINAITIQKNEFDNISPLEQEILEQNKFLKNKLKGFLGRENILLKISDYILSESTFNPLVLYGVSGMGKSSLFAKAIQNTQEQIKGNNILFRFVGATSNSTNIRNLLVSIINELSYKKVIDPIMNFEYDDTIFYDQIKSALSSILHPTIIFIDALDQLQDKEYLNWLPSQLSTNLKIIFSVLNDVNYEQDSHYFKVLSEKYTDNTNVINIEQDSLFLQKESLIKNLLYEVNRTIDDYQMQYVLTNWNKTNYSPLYLKIIIEQIKHWKSGEKRVSLQANIQDAILDYLKNLVRIYHHDEILVKKVFGYIQASKDGLSENELLNILSEDLEDDNRFNRSVINEWHEPIKIKNKRRDNKEEHILPISLWSRLHTQLKPFIIERNIDGQSLMKLFHRQFTTQVEKLIKAESKYLHTKLLDYFIDSTESRKAIEMIYHAYKISNSNSFFNLLLNEKILLININKGNLYQLVEYIKLLKNNGMLIDQFKELYLKQINSIEYFENLRYIAYLIGNITFENDVLNTWEEYTKKYNLEFSYNLYKFLADLHFRQGDSKLSIQYSDKAKQYVTSDQELLDLNLSLVRLYTFTGNTQKATELISEIKNSNIENTLSLKKKAEYFQELSFPFHDMDNNSMFASYNKHAKEIYKILNSKYDFCIAGVNEADGYWGAGQIEDAKIVMSESLQKADEWKLEHAIDISYICYSNILSSLDNVSKNLELYNKGIKLAQEIGHDWDELYGNIYYHLAKTETNSEDTFEKLIELSDIALGKDYKYLSELALSYSLVVSIFLNNYSNKSYKSINDLSFNSSKIYHLSFELLTKNKKENINLIFNLLDNMDGVKGRPYIIYYILDIHKNSFTLIQKEKFKTFSKKCYLKSSKLVKLYQERIVRDV